MTTRPTRNGTDLGIALSGGGHRAALFAAGALLGIVDAGQAANTLSICSVSGGSLTNGLIAKSGEFKKADRSWLETALKPGLRIFAHDGLFFPGKGTNGYVSRVFFLFGLLLANIGSGVAGLVAMGRHWPADQKTWLIATGCAALLALVALVKAPIWWGFRTTLAIGLLTGAALAPLAMLGTRDVTGWWAIAGVAAIGAVVLAVETATTGYFALRSARVDDAIADKLLGKVPLASVDREVHHLYCPTDLQSADHAYFSPRLVYGYYMGTSPPADKLRLSTAVQASACFPGGFVPRRLKADVVASEPLKQQHVVLTDGGVYDNMADQWEFGWDNRFGEFAKAGRDLTAYQARPASRLVVVNSGGSFKNRDLGGQRLLFEIGSLLRAKDIMYDVTTKLRRRYLVDIFLRATTVGDLHGALVHIGQQPTTVPQRTISEFPGTPQADRAQQALTFLTRLATLDPVNWAQVQAGNAAVHTVLSPLGSTISERLLHHAYVLTRINLFVLLDTGSLPGADSPDHGVLDEWGSDRFHQLVLSSGSS